MTGVIAGHGYVLAWYVEQLRGKALMDDIEGILVVISLTVGDS